MSFFFDCGRTHLLRRILEVNFDVPPFSALARRMITLKKCEGCDSRPNFDDKTWGQITFYAIELIAIIRPQIRGVPRGNESS
jgi:hypothetical protein